jgi:polyphosphate kinase 2 (PPK2 family)
MVDEDSPKPQQSPPPRLRITLSSESEPEKDITDLVVQISKVQIAVSNRDQKERLEQRERAAEEAAKIRTLK